MQFNRARFCVSGFSHAFVLLGTSSHVSRSKMQFVSPEILFTPCYLHTSPGRFRESESTEKKLYGFPLNMKNCSKFLLIDIASIINEPRSRPKITEHKLELAMNQEFIEEKFSSLDVPVTSTETFKVDMRELCFC